MSQFVKCLWAVLALCLMSVVASAQDKSRAYYNNHETEILPDAQTAFKNSEYERTVELCRLHYIVLGDSRADALREKAERCVKLTIEMEALAATVQKDETREKALAILALNPDDKRAQELAYVPTTGEIDGHEWVDLGLSVKWATCNLGAGSPTEAGVYFAWGEVVPKFKFTWKTYKYRLRGTNEDNVKFSKYNTDSRHGNMDNKTSLDQFDDVAYMIWGESWRIPTEKELRELLTQCTWTRTTQDGKRGYTVTGKNGNSIFLVAAGYKSGDNVVKSSDYGYYWSSSLDLRRSNRAYHLYFDFSDISLDKFAARYPGFLIRPVTP